MSFTLRLSYSLDGFPCHQICTGNRNDHPVCSGAATTLFYRYYHDESSISRTLSCATTAIVPRITWEHHGHKCAGSQLPKHVLAQPTPQYAYAASSGFYTGGPCTSLSKASNESTVQALCHSDQRCRYIAQAFDKGTICRKCDVRVANQ